MTLRAGMLASWLMLAVAVTATAAPPEADPEGRALGRAVDLWQRGDLQGAAAELARIDVSRGAAWAEADRAAFLLTVACLRLDDRARLEHAVAVAGDPAGTQWRQWVSYLGLLAGTGDPAPIDGFADATLLAAALDLDRGRPERAHDLLAGRDDPVALQLRALAAERSGRDARAAQERLAESKARTPGEADLVGAAILALAADDLAAGRDPRPRLQTMPPESRHAARAAHLLALQTLAAGDTSAAVGALADLATAHPRYAERRAVLLERAALAGAAGDWATALDLCVAAEADLAEAQARLEALLDPAGAAAAWAAWEDPAAWSSEIRLESDGVQRSLDAAVDLALDLRGTRDPSGPQAVTSPVAPTTSTAAPPADPDAEDWRQVRGLRGDLAAARAAAAAQAWELESLDRDLGRRAAYLQRGRQQAFASADTLAGALARLDRLLARLDLALADLDGARDQALHRFGTRCRGLGIELRRNLQYMAAVRHFHVEGPAVEPAPPAGVPRVAELLETEATLALALESFLDEFAARSTLLVNESHALVWRPRLEAGTHQLHTELAAELARAEQTAGGLELQLAGLAADPRRLAAQARHATLTARADSLADADRDLRLAIAADVAARGLALLATDAEAVALHAADAAYWLAVAADGDDDSGAAERLAARDRHVEYLAAYPESAARSELRFRLADLHLMQARDDFRRRMAAFLGENPSADALQDRGLAPYVDAAPAIALYTAILADDPGYAHREAVLFSLGMILADAGEPAGIDHLTTLVGEYAASPYAQEAWLRLGDAGFDRRDLDTCREAYAHAAEGDDPDLRAIALYKLGWARFEGDRFAGAADAFGALLDHGVPDGSKRAPQDLTAEAEDYLVRSLVRAGGAAAWADHFARHGDRPYAADVLFAMGAVERRFSLHAAAAAGDLLWLERYGDDAQALEVAARLVDTQRADNRPDAALDALLAQAPRFLAGSSWHQANADTTLRAAGQAFSQDAYRKAALRQHHLARQNGDADAWRGALGHYETWLGHWPDDAGAPRLHYQAGEAAERLGRHDVAIVHFTAAAAADSGDFVLDAAWQTVAVTDAWYDQAPADSLAARLLTTGERFLAAHPDDPRAADLRWRAGNVAYAHHWHARAAAAFTAFGAAHPADPRAPGAARLAGDAWYQQPDLVRAGDAYERALGLARAAGDDSLTTVLTATVPLVRFQHAEAVAADSTRGPAAAAPLFLAVAGAWPTFTHADLALYRAGLGLVGQDPAAAVAAWERLLSAHPDSEWDRDATLQIAQVHEAGGRTTEAATAYERFARRHADDPDAAEAMLTAIDLSADDPVGQRRRQEEFVASFAAETAAVMAIRAGWARAALAGSGGAASDADLAAYLAAAAAHPELADPRVLAEADYRTAEAALAAYEAIALTQPLAVSLERKQTRLEDVVALYNRCAGRGVAEFAHASAYRIGEAIVHFGDALAASERPADLSRDDLAAYDEVLAEQGGTFYARGEAAWTELLKQNRDAQRRPRRLDRPHPGGPVAAGGPALPASARGGVSAGGGRGAVASGQGAAVSPARALQFCDAEPGPERAESPLGGLPEA